MIQEQSEASLASKFNQYMSESHGKDIFEINNLSFVCFKSSSDTKYKTYFLSLTLISFLLKQGR